MRKCLISAGLLAVMTFAVPAFAAAASITTGDAYSNGSSGTASSVRAKFDAGDCGPAVSYDIGTQPLAAGGFRTVESAANTSSTPPGGITSDITTIRDLTAGTLYYYRAVLTTHSCATAGQRAEGAQRCLTKKGSINELESTPCPGGPAGPTPTPSPGPTPTPNPSATDPCAKPGVCPSNRLELPGRYCNVKNGFGETFMFALKVKRVKCKVAEALVDNNRRVSGNKLRFRLKPSKARCKAINTVGSSVEYACRLRRQKLWYRGYSNGQLTLKRQVWTDLFPR